MFVLQYFLALALLTGSPDATDLTEGPELFVTLGPTLQTVAIHLEILDPREVRYVLTWPTISRPT